MSCQNVLCILLDTEKELKLPSLSSGVIILSVHRDLWGTESCFCSVKSKWDLSSCKQTIIKWFCCDYSHIQGIKKTPKKPMIQILVVSTAIYHGNYLYLLILPAAFRLTASSLSSILAVAMFRFTLATDNRGRSQLRCSHFLVAWSAAKFWRETIFPILYIL